MVRWLVRVVSAWTNRSIENGPYAFRINRISRNCLLSVSIFRSYNRPVAPTLQRDGFCLQTRRHCAHKRKSLRFTFNLKQGSCVLETHWDLSTHIHQRPENAIREWGDAISLWTDSIRLSARTLMGMDATLASKSPQDFRCIYQFCHHPFDSHLQRAWNTDKFGWSTSFSEICEQRMFATENRKRLNLYETNLTHTLFSNDYYFYTGTR